MYEKTICNFVGNFYILMCWQVLEANVSLATLAESLQELNFNREKEDFLKEETEQVLSKMQSSFEVSFGQVNSIYHIYIRHNVLIGYV